MRRLFGQLGGMSSNDEMCSAMQAQRTIYSPGVARAFKAVDRAYFVSEAGDSESVEAAYTDMPLRHKYFHLSAPSIYGHALEALELSSGASFLNIGSGTGYFSALAANLIGVDAIHHGVEIQPRLVAHARSKLDSLGMHNIQLQTCTCFSIDPTSSMRFSRIYVGAGASQRSAELFFQLLEVGGVLVGPFSAYDGSQACHRSPFARGSDTFSLTSCSHPAPAAIAQGGAHLGARLSAERDHGSAVHASHLAAGFSGGGGGLPSRTGVESYHALAIPAQVP